MSNIALYRKWRPQTFDEVIEQGHVIATLKNSIASGRLAHAYLFCGMRGTGKTSMAHILARAINCLSPRDGNPCNECATCSGIMDGSVMDVIEIDAASNNSVDNIRRLRDDIVYSPISAKYKVYIIDEVHMLSGGAFNALLKTLEEPPPYAMFILATTEPHKLPATVLSRCQRFDFRRISPGAIAARLGLIASDAGVAADGDALALIAKLSEGAMRDATSILDQCISAASGGVLARGDVIRTVGLPDDSFLCAGGRILAGRDIRSVPGYMAELVASGGDLPRFVAGMQGFFRNVMLVKLGMGRDAFPEAPDDTFAEMGAMARFFDLDWLIAVIGEMSSLEYAVKTSPNQAILIEAALAKICAGSFRSAAAVEALNARVSELERRLAALGAGAGAGGGNGTWVGSGAGAGAYAGQQAPGVEAGTGAGAGAYAGAGAAGAARGDSGAGAGMGAGVSGVTAATGRGDGMGAGAGAYAGAGVSGNSADAHAGGVAVPVGAPDSGAGAIGADMAPAAGDGDLGASARMGGAAGAVAHVGAGVGGNSADAGGGALPAAADVAVRAGAGTPSAAMAGAPAGAAGAARSDGGATPGMGAGAALPASHAAPASIPGPAAPGMETAPAEAMAPMPIGGDKWMDVLNELKQSGAANLFSMLHRSAAYVRGADVFVVLSKETGPFCQELSKPANAKKIAKAVGAQAQGTFRVRVLRAGEEGELIAPPAPCAGAPQPVHAAHTPLAPHAPSVAHAPPPLAAHAQVQPAPAVWDARAPWEDAPWDGGALQAAPAGKQGEQGERGERGGQPEQLEQLERERERQPEQPEQTEQTERERHPEQGEQPERGEQEGQATQGEQGEQAEDQGEQGEQGARGGQTDAQRMEALASALREKNVPTNIYP